MSEESELIHATTVSLKGRAVLLSGPSGSGKSDLALRLIDRGAELVSDDYTVVRRLGSRLIATPPENIAGKIEVRGVGLVDIPHRHQAQVALILDLGAMPDRLPESAATRDICGIAVPLLPLLPFEASAPIKVALALKAHGLATDVDDDPEAS